jgi:hypothetical protein
VLAAEAPARSRPSAAEFALMRRIALDICKAVGNPLKRFGHAPYEPVF